MDKKRPTIDEIIGRTWLVKLREWLYDHYLEHVAEPYCDRFGHSKNLMKKFRGDVCLRCRRTVNDRSGLKFNVRM